MFNPNTNEISFPHVIPGCNLGGINHTYNSINGGIKVLADLNLIRNRFWGGNVEKLGLILGYGFYACPHYETKRILGFYIPTPEVLTEEGMRVLLERYPNAKLLGVINTNMHKALTQAEQETKSKLISEAVERGAIKAQVENTTIDELDGLIKAMDSGKAKTVKAEAENEVTELEEFDKHIVHKPVTNTTAKRRPATRR